MGLFKKKDGTPSLFGKIISAPAKLTAAVAPIAGSIFGMPALGQAAANLMNKEIDLVTGRNSVPKENITLGALSQDVINNGLLNGLQDKVSTATGGVIDITKMLPNVNDTGKTYADRLEIGLVGAMSGFYNQVQKPSSGGTFNDNLQKGFIGGISTKYIAYALGAIAGLLVLFLALKKK